MIRQNITSLLVIIFSIACDFVETHLTKERPERERGTYMAGQQIFPLFIYLHCA